MDDLQKDRIRNGGIHKKLEAIENKVRGAGLGICNGD